MDGSLRQIIAVGAWLPLLLAIAMQLLNLLYLIQNARGRGKPSQIHAVPVLLWWVAQICRGDGFFISPPLVELGIVAVVHIVTSIAAVVLERRRLRPAHEPLE